MATGNQEGSQYVGDVATQDVTKEMTPENALQILDRLTANMQLSRQDHQVVMQAVETLNKVIK